MRTVDLVIVGGGPAGLSTALHVHQASPQLAMVVLEKHAYPRDKICAGAIGARAFKLLDKLGIAIDCPMARLDAIALRVGGQTVVTRQPGLGVVVRRIEFDHALARQVIARGIEVRESCAVETITVTDEHVELTTATGDRYRARAIVGADGVGGIVRKQAGFPRGLLRAQVVELDTERVAQDQPRDTAAFDFEDRSLNGYAWDFPTIVGGQPLMCRGAYVIRNLGPDDARARIASYLRARDLDPAAYRLKQFAERGYQPGSEISAPRILLVGEAAGIDIATGEGIAQAIEYGSLAGAYLARAFARDRLAFSDWHLHVDRHHLGRQLWIRHACYGWFFGPRRPSVERLIPAVTAMFEVGIQDFAGLPLSKLALVRGAGQFLAAVTRAKLHES